MERAMAPSAEARIHASGLRGFAQPIDAALESRLAPYEPVLRRLVPLLIIAFLMVVGTAAALQIVNSRNEALAALRADLMTAAAAIDADLNHRITLSASDPVAAVQTALELTALRLAPQSGRLILAEAPDGTIAAVSPPALRAKLVGRPVSSVLTIGTEPGAAVRDARMVDSAAAYVVVRPLREPMTRLYVVQTVDAALEQWWRGTLLTSTLFATTGLLLFIIGIAFHIQTVRAATADMINHNARATIDAALQSGSCGLWDWEIGSDRMYWSASMFDLLGMAGREGVVTIAELEPLLHPDDGYLAGIASMTDLDLHTVVDLQFRMRHADGRWLWFRARGRGLSVAGVPHPRFVGIVVDITEQIALAERNAASDQRIREAIETISEAFVVCDDQDRIVVCNSKFRELNGLSEEHARPGTRYQEALARGGGIQVIDGRILTNDKGDGARDLEVELADGRWLQISERRTDCGGYVSVGTDITALKLHESRILASEQRLRSTVSDLQRSQHALEMQTQQLAELAEKYSEQKNQAEEANLAKSKFLANMSHELRTPLNAIIGFSEVMKDGHFGPIGAPKYLEYARDIHDSGCFLLSLIDDILDMARIEAGRMKLSLETINLDETLDETIRVVAKLAADKQILIEAEIPDSMQLTADRRAVKQVFLNLLSNAVKFTPPGGMISVRSRRARGFVALAIEDTGIGIPRQAIRNLGRPFEQVQGQFSKNHNGSGLGLAIAKSLVEMHGGTLKIRSAVGRGTTVLVRLPENGPALAEREAMVASA
jgi:two-component system cell cycle sensor histidine kinase PleC